MYVKVYPTYDLAGALFGVVVAVIGTRRKSETSATVQYVTIVL